MNYEKIFFSIVLAKQLAALCTAQLKWLDRAWDEFSDEDAQAQAKEWLGQYVRVFKLRLAAMAAADKLETDHELEIALAELDAFLDMGLETTARKLCKRVLAGGQNQKVIDDLWRGAPSPPVLVREQIDQLREQKGTWTPVEERPLEGDLVTVHLASADADGVVGEPNEYKIEIGREQAIAGVEEIIMACAPGESKEQPVRWPDDFPDAEEAGKTKLVRVTVSDVKRKTLPPLDDSFASEIGDFESIAALEEAVRKDMEAQAAREADATVRQRLVDEILAANPFPVPPSWVNRLLGMYAETYGVPQEEQQRFAEEFAPTAERQVRRDLVVETIAEREKLTATEKDLDDKIAELAEKRSMDPGKLYASLEKAGRLKELERGITEDRVFALLLERNTVVPEE